MDKALKQRLVGASVLIALAVIVLPMLLNGRPENSTPQSQKIEIPPRPDELSFETRRFPIDDSQAVTHPAEHSGSSGDNRPQVSSGSTVTAPSESDPLEVPSDPPQMPDDGSPAPVEEKVSSVSDSLEPGSPAIESPVKSAPLQTVPPSHPQVQVQTTKSAGRYVVQVASLGSAENASRLISSLQQSGYPVLLDTIESDVGRLNRVRVGPYEQETEATTASVRIGKDLQGEGVSPRVVDLYPEQSAPVNIPNDPLVRWIVQVGSFSEASNAENLVKQLRADGLSAYSETVTSSSASVFRVRIGPFIERNEAIGVNKQISDQLAINGVVMSTE